MKRLESFSILSALLFPLLFSIPAAIAADPGSEPPAKLKDLNGFFPFAVPDSLEAWESRADLLRRRVLVANGLYPLPERTPLNAVIHGKFEREGCTIEKVYFESVPGFHVTGLLFREKRDSREKIPGGAFASWTRRPAL